MSMDCPKCDSEIEIVGDPFSVLARDARVDCPHCHALLQLDYDSFYNDETGDCYGYFSLHLRESS